MTARLRYKSVNDGSTGKKNTGKRMMSILRLMKLFRKKENDKRCHEKQPTNDDSRSISESTANLSPMKEDDSYAEKFDAHFASTPVHHVPMAKKDEHDLLVQNSLSQCQASLEAGEIKVSGSQQQQAQNRIQSNLNVFPLPIIDNGIAPLPMTPANFSKGKPKSFKTSATGATEETAKVMDSTSKPLVSLEDVVIDSAQQSSVKRNFILETISSVPNAIELKNQFSQRAEKIPPVFRSDIKEGIKKQRNIGESSKKTKVSHSMEDVKSYLSQLKEGAMMASEDRESVDVKKYQQLIRTKFSSLVNSISAAAPDVKQASSAMHSSCEKHLCSIFYCTSDLINPTMNQSPLDESWFTMYDDSDTVSRLSMPFHSSELSMGVDSNYDMSEFGY